MAAVCVMALSCLPPNGDRARDLQVARPDRWSSRAASSAPRWDRRHRSAAPRRSRGSPGPRPPACALPGNPTPLPLASVTQAPRSIGLTVLPTTSQCSSPPNRSRARGRTASPSSSRGGSCAPAPIASERAARPAAAEKLKLSARPEQRNASMPCEVWNTTPPSASERIVPGSRSSLPVFGFVRSSSTELPTAAAISADGLSKAASRFFSMTSSNPVTIALAGSIPSATPSKRSRLVPAGSCTVRVSLTNAKPSSRSRSIDPEPR